MNRIFSILLVACSLLLTADAYAHEARPVYVEITETTAATYLAHWKTPASIPEDAIPELSMPGNCTARGAVIAAHDQDAHLRRQEYICEGGISGRSIGLQYPLINPSISSLLRVELRNGEIHSHIMKPGTSTWLVPEKESPLGVAGEYLALGIEHIFAGIDHLLFVVCLVFIARTGHRILITITGFTLAHSLTLALSTLRIVELPVPPVEAVIALSILFLAHEIAVADRESWTWRYPITVASSFGLLHGFGFAAVLRAIGLPQTELPAALLFFNLGVETGQIIIVGAVVAVMAATRRFRLNTIAPARIHAFSVATVYLIGGLAGFWLIERVIKFWI